MSGNQHASLGQSPFIIGLQGRCPDCGNGNIFDGLLKFAPRCEACGVNFDGEDAGDGPAIFVIFLVGIFIIPAALAFQLISQAPMWVTFIIWVPIIIVACLYLLRLMRGIMFSLQWTHKAREAVSRKSKPNEP